MNTFLLSFEIKMGQKPRTILVEDERGDLLADFHNVLNRWKNYFSITECHRVSAVRQMGKHTAKPLVPEPSFFEVKIAVAKLERYKLPGIKLWQNKIENLSDVHPVQNGLMQGDAIAIALENTIRKVPENLEGLKLKRTHQILVCPDDVNLFGDNINATKKTEKLSSMLVTRF
jgi:hypothetical protein